MANRTRKSNENDSPFDLFLDTVSNVFGGVMFLTLLAALLVLTRGASSLDAPPQTPSEANVDARTVAMDIEATELAIQSQQMLLKHLKMDEDSIDKAVQLENLEQSVDQAEREAKLAEQAIPRQQVEDQQRQQQDLSQQRARLEETLASEQDKRDRLRRASERTVKFRPLQRSNTFETVVVLRYGKIYLFKDRPLSTSFNEDDFFVTRQLGRVMTITPKPHRGEPVNEATVDQIIRRLSSSFPPSRFHVTIAVWDDSFGEFNTLRDAVVKAGYQYRTIPSDNTTELSFGEVKESWVQ